MMQWTNQNGWDMDMDKDPEGDAEGDVEDRVVDLEDALDELKAEFEAMMGDNKDGEKTKKKSLWKCQLLKLNQKCHMKVRKT